MAEVSPWGAGLTTSCFGGAAGHTLSSLSVRVRACSHQVLDHLRPLEATFSPDGVTCRRWAGHPSGGRVTVFWFCYLSGFVQTQGEGSEWRRGGVWGAPSAFPTSGRLSPSGISLRSSGGMGSEAAVVRQVANIWMAAAKLLPSCFPKPAGLSWASISRSRCPSHCQMLAPPCPR